MVKTYPEFIDVIDRKIALYSQIPDEHLSFEGTNVLSLYKAVQFVACFASTASELLTMLDEDEDVAFEAKYDGAKSEYRSIHRCLERLAVADVTHLTIEGDQHERPAITI